MADLMEAQQPIMEGTSATIRRHSGACEVEALLTDAAVSGVRALVSACLHLWGLAELDWRVTLAASELLTNAFQHARKDGEQSVPVKIVLTRTPDGVFLCVSDPHPRLPALVSPGNCDEGGRGLLLVEELSNEYGCSSTAHGKDVWVTILRST
ncbi:ATP-binding protein [Streptomyces sp. Lzd4kr]|nr:ATP-binding protein [Streptomyces sp. Lzd4kr]